MLRTAAAEASRLESVVARALGEDGAGFECTPAGHLWRLWIWGWFPPDWSGSLSLHCYAARLSVIEADALRVRTSLWAGCFLLEPAPGAHSPRALDFVHMARHRPSGIARPDGVRVDTLRIEPEAEERAARVRVEAPDRIGFLAGVLEQFAFCGLYPHQLSVRTAHGRASDVFDVYGIGGTPPLPRALATLELLLRPRPGRVR
jgi:hypothetical protein